MSAPEPAQATSTWITQISALGPVIFLGALWAISKVKEAVTAGSEAKVSIFNSKRRVATVERDYAMEQLRGQIKELSDALEEQRNRYDKDKAEQKAQAEKDRAEQQAQIDEHSRVIQDLRYDLSDTRSYGWEAYTEIRRLDPATAFRKPPKLRTAQNRAPEPQD